MQTLPPNHRAIVDFALLANLVRAAPCTDGLAEHNAIRVNTVQDSERCQELIGPSLINRQPGGEPGIAQQM